MNFIDVFFLFYDSPVVTETAEVSVYDLKDHPDFKFRPGSIVVRVADTGESSVGAAGQVLDNHQTGKVISYFFKRKKKEKVYEQQITDCDPLNYSNGFVDNFIMEFWGILLRFIEILTRFFEKITMKIHHE